MTECGLDASKVKALSRDDYFARHKELGMQRCAMMTCMTCSQTATRWKRWEDDPRQALGREVEWENSWRRSDRGDLLRDELLAIAALIEAHKDEFQNLLDAEERRRVWLKMKAERPAGAKPQ
jgi:hypothetical protein